MKESILLNKTQLLLDNKGSPCRIRMEVLIKLNNLILGEFKNAGYFFQQGWKLEDIYGS